MGEEAALSKENWFRLPAAESGCADVYFIGDDEVWITQVDGKMVGLSNICTHKLGPIAEGTRLSYNCAQCPWHGYEFDLRTGECINAKVVPLKRYEVKSQNGNLYVRKIVKE